MAENNKTEYYTDVFPSPILPDDEKKSKKYGLAVAQGIWRTAVMGGTGYYSVRNLQFNENIIFANGKQPFKTYLSLMQIDGKNSFTNLDYHPRPVAPKFRDILINSIMERVERVNCRGLSLEINKKKEDKKNDAAFRMKEAEFIKQVQQESGVEFEDSNAFVPTSYEDLDLWSELNEKEREELLMEEGLNFILYNNDWDAIKKEVCGDLVDTGMGFTQNYFDGCNRIRIRRIKPEFMAYSNTHHLDFRGSPYMAHLERMSITDVRSMWPDVSEEKLYELATNYIAKYGNPNSLIEYNMDWNNAYTRPYDSFIIDVLFFEYRVTKTINVVKSYDKNGKLVVEYVKDTYVPTSDKKLSKKPIPTIYNGAWLVGSQILPMWGEMPNLLRSNEDVEDVRFSYGPYMLNNDGTMMPKSPIDFMKSSIIQMDLAILKIQQHLATSAPDGTRIDIDSAIDLDLGKGIGKIGALKLREIRLQTGDEYWSSKAADGNPSRPALENAPHPLGDKITQFINVYNFELNNIRDYIGVNEVRDGSGVNPRMGLGVLNNQIQASNTATAHIYGGFISIMTNTLKGCALRLWDTLKQADVNSMYIRLLGKQNSDFIKRRKDITSSNYDVMISVDMSQDDKLFLEENIKNGLAGGTLEFEDAVYVRKVPNLDLAIRYLGFIKKKRLKQAQDAQLEQEKQLADQQAQLQAQADKAKAAIQVQLDDLELKKTAAKGQIDQQLAVQELINNSLLKSMDENAKPIPEYVQFLIDKQAKEIAEQEMLEQQQAEEQELLEQQQMDEEMMMGEEEGMGEEMSQMG